MFPVMSRMSNLTADERRRVYHATRTAMFVPLVMVFVGYAVFKVGKWHGTSDTLAMIGAGIGLVCALLTIASGYSARQREFDAIEGDRQAASRRERYARAAAEAANAAAAKPAV